jgi:hypothetical protein
MGYICTIELEFESNREFPIPFPHLFSIPFFCFFLFGSCLEFAGFGVSEKEGTIRAGLQTRSFFVVVETYKALLHTNENIFRL